MDTEAIDHSELQPTQRPNTPCEHENCLRASCECIVSNRMEQNVTQPPIPPFDTPCVGLLMAGRQTPSTSLIS